MRIPEFALRALAAFVLISTIPAILPARGARIPSADFPPGFSFPKSDIEFEYTIPLDELSPGGWTQPQRDAIAYHREQMRKRDEIFLLVRVVLDATGEDRENAMLAADIAQSVGVMLRDAGIPADRLLLLPGREEKGSLEGSRIPPPGRFRKVEIFGILGGGWLRRRRPAEVKKEIDLPAPPGIVLLAPASGTTDRANHVLRGTTDPSIASASVTIGRETRTVSIRDGTFELPISLRPGENPIVVTALDPYGRAVRASRIVHYAPPRPTIEIRTPAEGTVTDVSRSPVVVVRGEIRSSSPLREAFLIQNDIPRKIAVSSHGTFEQPAILVTEADTFQVEAIDAAGQVGTSAVRPAPTGGLAERPLMAILNWDEDDVDVDLHVTDREGNHTWFDAPDPADTPGAVPDGKLWIDNRKGFGPEVFSLERIVSGEYTVSAEQYRGKKPCRAYLTLVLFAGTPSRKLVQIYGPVTLTPNGGPVPIVRVSLPSGVVSEPPGIRFERSNR